MSTQRVSFSSPNVKEMKQIEQFLEQAQHLPPAPRPLAKLVEYTSEPDQDIEEMVNIISYDQGLTASIIKLSNSAILGSSIPTDSLKDAAFRIGYNEVYRLAMVICGEQILQCNPSSGVDPDELWRHSVTTALAAQKIAQIVSANENVAFTAGLLHDVGKVVFAEVLITTYANILKEIELHQYPESETERELIGIEHAELGGKLLSRWNFPMSLCGAVTHHHSPDKAGANTVLASIIYLANHIAYFIGHGFGNQTLSLYQKRNVMRLLELEPNHLCYVIDKTLQSFESTKSFFNMRK